MNDKKQKEIEALLVNAIIINSTTKEAAEYIYKAGYRKQSETVKEFAEKAINSLNKYCYIPRQVSFDAGFIEGIKQAQATLMELAEQYGKEE